jgi:hypothetical protein
MHASPSAALAPQGAQGLSNIWPSKLPSPPKPGPSPTVPSSRRCVINSDGGVGTWNGAFTLDAGDAKEMATARALLAGEGVPEPCEGAGSGARRKLGSSTAVPCKTRAAAPMQAA